MGGESLTQDQVERFRKVFNHFDKDKGGTIDKDELGCAMYSLGATPTKLEIQEMIDAVDADKSGTIDFNEFLDMMANKINDMDTEDDLIEALQLFDVQKRGTISNAVLKHALLSIGEKMTEEEVQFVFDRLKPNQEGKYEIKMVASFLLTNTLQGQQ